MIPSMVFFSRISLSCQFSPFQKPIPDLPGMKPSPARIDDGHCGDDHRQDKTGGPDHDVEEDFPDEGRGTVIRGHNRHGPGLGCESDRGIGHDHPLRTALLPLQQVLPVSLFSGKKGLSKRRQIGILPELQRSRIPADHAVPGMKQNLAAPVQKPGRIDFPDRTEGIVVEGGQGETMPESFRRIRLPNGISARRRLRPGRCFPDRPAGKGRRRPVFRSPGPDGREASPRHRPPCRRQKGDNSSGWRRPRP